MKTNQSAFLRKSTNSHQRIKKTSQYPFFAELIKEWKPRAKKIKYKLKELAADSGIRPQHLTKLISGHCDNPKIDTINNVEMSLRSKEKEAGK